MREIRQSGSVRGVRSNPYPYRDPVCLGTVMLPTAYGTSGMLFVNPVELSHRFRVDAMPA